MAALPSSDAANRCWTTHRPTGFRDAVCIMGCVRRRRPYL